MINDVKNDIKKKEKFVPCPICIAHDIDKDDNNEEFCPACEGTRIWEDLTHILQIDQNTVSTKSESRRDKLNFFL